jgi:hypothetical protein
VGDFAAPAFGDMDDDGRLDLFVGNANGRLLFYRNESTVNVTERPHENSPIAFRLSPIYPHPLINATSFILSATIRFQLPHRSFVTLKIYNTLGQEVRALLSRHFEAGQHEMVWDGRDDWGEKLRSGVYFLRMRALRVSTTAESVRVRKIILIE